MNRKLILGFGCGSGLIVLAAGCSALDLGFIATVDAMVDGGQLTPEQGSMVIQGYLDWTKQAAMAGWWNTIMVGLGAIIASYTGINLFPGKKIRNPSPAA